VNASITSYDNTSLFVLLRRLMMILGIADWPTDIWVFSDNRDLIACRDTLLANLELIMYFHLAFGTDEQLKTTCIITPKSGWVAARVQ
jgi:hypothetical protein